MKGQTWANIVHTKLKCLTSESSNPVWVVDCHQCITSDTFHLSEFRTICSWSHELSQVFSILAPSAPLRLRPPDTIQWWFIVWTICVLYLLHFAQCIVTNHSWLHWLSFVLGRIGCTSILLIPDICRPRHPRRGCKNFKLRGIFSIFDVKGTLLNFTIIWHHLNWLWIWPLDGATYHFQVANCVVLTDRHPDLQIGLPGSNKNTNNGTQ